MKVTVGGWGPTLQNGNAVRGDGDLMSPHLYIGTNTVYFNDMAPAQEATDVALQLRTVSGFARGQTIVVEEFGTPDGLLAFSDGNTTTAATPAAKRSTPMRCSGNRFRDLGGRAGNRRAAVDFLSAQRRERAALTTERRGPHHPIGLRQTASDHARATRTLRSRGHLMHGRPTAPRDTTHSELTYLVMVSRVEPPRAKASGALAEARGFVFAQPPFDRLRMTKWGAQDDEVGCSTDEVGRWT